MDKESISLLRKIKPELCEELSKISMNFRKMNALMKCLDSQLTENGIFSDKEISHLFDVIKILLTETLEDFEKIEDNLNI